jgi:restriction endonuclease S subunit
MFKDIDFNNPTYRLDSEFFKKDYSSLFKILLSKKTSKLISLSKWITQGPNPVFDESAIIPCLTGRNISNGRVDYNNADYVSDFEYSNLERFQLKPGDTLITLKGKGSIGKIGYVTEHRKSIFSRDIGVIRPDNINPAYVNAYILSKYGSKIIERGETGGTGQSTLTASYLKNIDIVRLDIENQIGELITESEIVLKQSQILYTQADNLLLQEIGLDEKVTGLNPVEVTNTNVKSFKESFGVTGRLDAEYYQKKYEVVIEKIKSQRHDTLYSIVEINKSIEPGSNYYSDDETGLPFMRVADYNKFGLSEPNKKLTNDFVKDNQDKIDDLKPKKGTILFSKDGSVGTAYHLREDFNGVTSSAILHLKVKTEKEVIPEYLTLALNSKLVQMQAERDAGGSIILHWRVGEIQNVVVPIIDYKKQQEIAALIEKSFSLKQQSEHLLEVAKKAVEIAIEESEEVAMKFINENV